MNQNVLCILMLCKSSYHHKDKSLAFHNRILCYFQRMPRIHMLHRSYWGDPTQGFKSYRKIAIQGFPSMTGFSYPQVFHL